MIPISRPSIGEEELAEVRKVFQTGWLGMGSWVFEFEKALAGYLGAKNVIAVNTGTSALHIALDALGLGAGDEVLVPSLTFAASIQAITCCGARPVFCDVRGETLNIDLEDVKSKINPRVRVIMPVHYGGLPCDMDGLLKIAHGHKAVVVEDAAHAFGSLYKGRKIGSFGDISCFSFDPIKNITCGEGGAVVLKDKALAQQVIRKRILGIDKDTWHRYKNERSWFYEVVTKGYRYHMSNINAAIGMIQLKKMKEVLRDRRDTCRQYDAGFRGVEEIEILKRDYNSIAPFNYIIKVKNDRDGLLNYLNKNGVGAGIHYIPNHLQPVFKEFHASLPATEAVYKSMLSLPLYFGMEQNDTSKVIETLKGYFR